MNIENYDRDARIGRIDEAAREVSDLLPFPVTLEADMGGHWALYIELGRRGEHEDDPSDTVGIDPDHYPLEWMLDIDGGHQVIESGLNLDASPLAVAQWIVDQVAIVGTPVGTPVGQS